jgi:hypothetical protein
MPRFFCGRINLLERHRGNRDIDSDGPGFDVWNPNNQILGEAR